jgi:hypothetical protein
MPKALLKFFGTLLPWALSLSAIPQSSAATFQSARAARPSLESLPPERERLEEIGYRLARANASRCSQPQMLTGLAMHDAGAYSAADRELMQNVHDLTYGFGVLNTVPGSPAARAGIKAGDEIVVVNGLRLETFAAGDIKSQATYKRTERFVAYLDRALSNGPVRLGVRRGPTFRDVILSAEPGCGGRVAFLKRTQPEAWSDGHYVAVTQRMVDFAETDAELAFVVAHEMAHNVLQHADRNKGPASLLAQFGIGAGKIKRAEIEADRLAIELMANAGYDTSGSISLLGKTARLIPLDLGLTHPRVSRRVEIVSAAIARLQDARVSLN